MPERVQDWDGYTERRVGRGLETRLIRLEVTLENFSRDITKHIDSHAVAMREIAGKLEGLRPPFLQVVGTCVGVIGVLLVIIGMVGKVAVLDPLQRFETRLIMVEKHTSDGHPHRVIREIELLREELMRHDKERRGIVGETPRETKR